MRRTQADIDSDKRVLTITAAIEEVPYEDYGDLATALLSKELAATLPTESDRVDEAVVRCIREAFARAAPTATFGERLLAVGRALSSSGGMIVRDERKARSS